jgi:deoxyadenosine/deoxycytidine kinase
MGMRIAIEGNIGSGKSTVMKALADRFPDIPVFSEPVATWGDLLDLFYADPCTWALPFSLKVLLTFRDPGRHSECLVERCPLSCRHVFTQTLFNEGTMQQHSYDLFKEFYDILAWTPDVIIYIDTPTDKCLNRIHERGRLCETHGGIDIFEYLRRIEFAYETMLKFVSKDIRVIRIDGKQSPECVAEAVSNAVKEVM